MVLGLIGVFATLSFLQNSLSMSVHGFRGIGRQVESVQANSSSVVAAPTPDVKCQEERKGKGVFSHMKVENIYEWTGNDWNCEIIFHLKV